MIKEITSPDFTQHGIFCGELNGRVAELVGAHLPAPHLYVGDNQTLRAAKELIPRDAALITLGKSPKASTEMAQRVVVQAAPYASIVAIGSGTMNDLCKYAAHQSGKPYGVIATAASMNGYASSTASLTLQGQKQSLTASTAKLILCDIPTLQAAPPRLTQAGIGDTLCRQMVECDAMLSHWLTGSAYPAQWFARLREAEAGLLPIRSDGVNIEALTQCLLLSGFAMRDLESSLPASQGEHMITHLMEMFTSDMRQPLHGRAIGVTSLYMVQLQERSIASPTPPQLVYRDDFSALPQHLQAAAQEAYQRKIPSREWVETANQKLRDNWPKWQAELSAICFFNAEKFEATLKAANCATTPEEIHWDGATYQTATQHAALTRDRLGFLDLT